ncbi:MAG TPA: redox-regulated ATPase YchF [Bdellovibrionota bacterium]|jgi:GTP-binding protein YchF|nr:redox-regulated ATPase YchF [Bdellovibrionota bacterium]
MALECGIVGLPNVGKSTLFNALTSSENAAAANYPFCTIDPNVGVVEVPDARLGQIAGIVKPERVIPTSMSFVDIAGLVKGASKGEGLGNQFLGHIKSCDAVAHVVRCFEDGDVIHVDGSVDPVRDVEVIETELMLADLSTVEKRMERNAKLAKSDKKAAAVQETLNKIKTTLEAGNVVRSLELSPEEKEAVRDLHLITQKPMIFVANLDEASAGTGSEEKNAYYQKLKAYAEKQKAQVIPVCAKVESELVALEPAERTEFLKDLGIQEAGLNKVIRAAYKTLGLATYFTAGVKEVRAWTIHEGWSAPQAAGVIHSDFERGFICAETFHYNDLIKCGNEAKVKEAGLMRTEGKTYTVKDGDVLHFRFNV